MANVTTDDVRLALVLASEKSNSVYRSVYMLYKAIFNSAVNSNIIDYSPYEHISQKAANRKKIRMLLRMSRFPNFSPLLRIYRLMFSL